MSGMNRTLARCLPKVLLHEHLDGGLRESTLLELLQARGLKAPAADLAGLVAWLDARAHAGSLEAYLEGFGLTVAAMASCQGLRRVAFEAAQDAFDDGCVLAEFRIAPLLFGPWGLSPDAVVEALLEGLSQCPLPTGLIVCAMRHQPDTVAQAVDLALRWQGRGVVGFDLAGPEAGWPAVAYAPDLARVTDAGLGLTLHAGEADGPHRVLEAVMLGARRIGHGVRLADWLEEGQHPDDLALLRQRGIHLEVCPTSNVHTGVATSVSAHPIAALWRSGLSLSFHTDNRLISRVSPSSEALALVEQAHLGWNDLQAMGVAAARASFLPEAMRTQAEEAVRRWAPPDLSLG